MFDTKALSIVFFVFLFFSKSTAFFKQLETSFFLQGKPRVAAATAMQHLAEALSKKILKSYC